MGSKSQQPAARLGDIDTGHHSYPPTLIVTASENVLINGLGAARLGDNLAPHHPAVPVVPPDEELAEAGAAEAAETPDTTAEGAEGEPAEGAAEAEAAADIIEAAEALPIMAEPPLRVIVEGSASVLINGMPAARVTDAIDCGGTLIIGSTNVLIGDNPQPIRSGPSSAELKELLQAGMQSGHRRQTPRQQAQLAADIAMKHRGEAGALDVWANHFRSQPAEPGDASDPVRGAALKEVEQGQAESLRSEEHLGKAQRWRERQQQIAKGREQAAAMPPGAERDRLTQAADRFAQNNVAVEKARLSQDVYSDESGPPPGWIDISDDPEELDRLGLKKSHLEEPNSAFRARVYKPDPAVFGTDMKPTVTFKGTDPSCFEDMKNNLQQAFNWDSLYYRKAVAVGTAIEQKGVHVDFAGHSLGGGLASAAARASGQPGHTFNAAGLHDKTVERYGGTPKIGDPDNILAYHVEGDLVTEGQEMQPLKKAGAGIGGLLGAQYGHHGAVLGAGMGGVLAPRLPTAAGIPHALAGSGFFNPVERHKIDHVIDSIEQQKQEDQEVLNASSGND